ncbi:MAG: lipase maturation factor family protein, partial [Parachlamydiaceae bacterium]
MTPVDIFIRLLGFVYFFAFGAFIFQIKGLLGNNGILPIARFLEFLKIRFHKENYRLKFPTLFWINDSDNALLFNAYIGTALSLILMFGIYPALILFLLYILYLSIVTVGQIFLGYGWEGFLLEITAHAFLLSLTDVPNIMVWLSVNFLLFRFHFQAGAVKLASNDRNWRNLTAISYHYETQPLPNTIAYYIYRAPMWFHKLSCL